MKKEWIEFDFHGTHKKPELARGGTGKVLAVNNKTRAETFMKMVEIQAGLGIGIKKFRLVWVFQNKSDFDAFVNSGWELGAQASATAKTADKGGGLEGTRYYKDDDLN